MPGKGSVETAYTRTEEQRRNDLSSETMKVEDSVDTTYAKQGNWVIRRSDDEKTSNSVRAGAHNLLR